MVDAKATVDALRPLVYGYKSTEDLAEDDESEFEDVLKPYACA